MSNSTSSKEVFLTKNQYEKALSKIVDEFTKKYTNRDWDEPTMEYKTFKVVLIGDKNTGKTEYIKRFQKRDLTKPIFQL